MKIPFRRLFSTFASPLLAGLLAASVLSAQAAQADAPHSIRIAVPDLSAGSQPSAGGVVDVLRSQQLLEQEFAKDGIHIDWRFFKGAGPVINEALANGQADFAYLGDLAAIIGKTFAPSLAVRYFEEATAATPVLSPELAGGPGVGRVDLLPEISRRYQMNSDTFVEPRFAVGGFWALDDLAHTPSAHGAMTDVRLKAEAGVSLGVKEGASLSAVGGVEQGAEAAENVWSGQLQLKVPLNK